MDRLSGLDASFLYLETPAQLMHVCGLIVLDPSTMPEPYSFAAMRDGIEARVRDVPDFTRKLRRVPLGLDHPVWVRDTPVRHRAPRAPARAAHAGRVRRAHRAGRPPRRPAAGPLPPALGDVGDRGLPSEDGRDLIAVFSKMHHATVDGVSGANLISHLCSLEPDAAAARRPAGEEGWPHEPGQRELFGARAGHHRHPAVHEPSG